MFMIELKELQKTKCGYKLGFLLACFLPFGLSCVNRKFESNVKARINESKIQKNSLSEKEQDELQSLKDKIVAILLPDRANTDDRELVKERRKEVVPLIKRILEIVPTQESKNQTDQIVGVWRSIWRDEMQPGGPQIIKADAENSYQVFPGVKNFYLNMSTVTISPPGTTPEQWKKGSSVLVATYENKDTFKKAKFERVYRGDTKLPPAEKLMEFAKEVLNGTSKEVTLIDSLETIKPDYKGPIGRVGEHRTLFVDDTLRITLATNGNDAQNIDLDSEDYFLNVVERVSQEEK
jgi:hypothetical protein